MYHFNTSYLEKNLSPKEIKAMYGLKVMDRSGLTIKAIFDKKDECLHIKGGDLRDIYSSIYRRLETPFFPNIFHKGNTREDAFRYLKELETAATTS